MFKWLLRLWGTPLTAPDYTQDMFNNRMRVEVTSTHKKGVIVLWHDPAENYAAKAEVYTGEGHGWPSEFDVIPLHGMIDREQARRTAEFVWRNDGRLPVRSS